jgi:hypothetical protein
VWDDLWSIDTLAEHESWLLESPWPVLALAWLLIAGCVVAFGWVEDLAAKRRPRVWPDGGRHPG